MSDEGWLSHLSAPCCVGHGHMFWDIEAGQI